MYKDNGIDPIEPASQKMRQIIIELTKIETIPSMFLNKMFAVWMQFIKDPNSIPPEFLAIDEVKEAMDELQYMSADPQTRAEYDARVKQLNDIRAAQSVKYNEGLAEGEKIAKVESAKRFLAMGLSLEQIAQGTGLSIEDVSNLVH